MSKLCTQQNMGKDVLVIVVYVDDPLITGSNTASIKEFKEQMAKKFDMSDLGKLTYYLGIEVEQGNGCILIKQSGYANKILNKTGMLDCNSIKFPMYPKKIINKDNDGVLVDPTKFKSMIGEG